jgi:UDP-N-acetylmuramoyl-L-alanyl-D-glutamate--2,6-diaminopimelate ligase
MKKLIKKITPRFLLNFYHYCLAFMGAFWYGLPAKKMTLVGVTGTGGKSTTVEFIAKILEQAGYKTAFLSSIKFKIADYERENDLKMTMPGRMKIQKFLKQALKANCKYVVLEVTSEGIRQFRNKFIDFDIAVFTNLSPEHIEAHKGFENYRQAKLKLFKSAKKIHVINLDDNNTAHFLKIPAVKKYGYTLKRESARFVASVEDVDANHADSQDVSNKGQTRMNAKNLTIVACSAFASDESGTNFEVQGVSFHLDLLGKFNVYNSLAAICVGLSQGISLEKCKIALSEIQKVEGRMEIVIREPFLVIVDYAHTPDSLLNVYKTLSKLKNARQASKVICVLGSCGGGRDKWKRPEMGKIAFKYCDEVFVTNEDPYDEDPLEIINQVAQGVQGKAHRILDRREAIKKAMEVAKNNDIVIITGKGSEPWMCVKDGKKIKWDDRKIVREEINH